jgi:antitoxin MazE
LEGESTALVQVENGSIVLSKSSKPLRAGWAEAAAVVSAQGEDGLLMDEFGNADDAELRW